MRAAAALLAALLALWTALASGAALAQFTDQSILVVNSQAVLETSDTGKRLRATEAQVRAEVQAAFDEVSRSLKAEEAELTRLRDQLARAEFDDRARAFDKRVRKEREAAQARSAALRGWFRDVSAEIQRALPSVLEDLRRDYGARLILNAGAVLAADPSLDVTGDAIARLDAALADRDFTPPPALLAPVQER